jgi:hypothetical protein
MSSWAGLHVGLEYIISVTIHTCHVEFLISWI